jgi:hypothetical protein
MNLEKKEIILLQEEEKNQTKNFNFLLKWIKYIIK